MRELCLTVALLAGIGVHAPAADPGGKVECVGGTIAEVPEGHKGHLLTVNQRFLVYESKSGHYLIPWDSINVLEYGQKVSRRLAMAVLISPVLALSKSRKHFLTIGFESPDGEQQALLFRVHKSDIRSLLVSIEMKADLPVEYQDEEARRAGKG